MISKYPLRGGNAMQEKSTVLRRIVFMYAVLATICALTVSTAESQAPNTHALIHIRNESNARATLYYRWGDRAWRKYVIEQQKGAYFNWPYDGTSQSSPSFIVKLDVDTQGVRCMEHVLSRGASPDDNSINYGNHYVIKQIQGTDTRYIQAVSQKATVKVTDKNCSFVDDAAARRGAAVKDAGKAKADTTTTTKSRPKVTVKLDDHQ